MGQIIGGAAKPKRCNLSKLSQLSTPAAGEHILVSSDNSMNAAGQGNFDCYIVGDGTTAATALPLIPIAGSSIKYGEKNSVTGGAVFNALPNENVSINADGNTTNGSMRITSGVVAYNSSDNYKVIGLQSPIHLKKGDVLIINNGNSVYVGTWCSVVTQVVITNDTPSYTCLVNGRGTSVYEYAAEAEMDVIICTNTVLSMNVHRLVEAVKRNEVIDDVVEGSTDVITSGGIYNILPQKDEEVDILNNQVGGGMRISNNVVSYNDSDTYFVVGLNDPIHLDKGDTIVINNGASVYIGTWCSAVTEVVDGNYSVLLKGTGSAVYKYTAPRDMDVIVCKPTNWMEVEVTGLVKLDKMLTQDNVDQSVEEDSENPVSSGAVADFLVAVAMKSSTYPNGTRTDNSVKRFLTKGRKNNKPYINKRILGINIHAYNAGQISVVKGVFNDNYTQIVDGTYETLQTFNVAAGINKLRFTNPVVLAENEYIGVDGTASLYYGEYLEGTTNYYWYDSSLATYRFADKEMDIELIVSTIPADTNTIEDLARSVGENQNSINATDKLLALPFFDNPFYYHWNPNGFTDGIPSQSVEDNMLAKRLGFSMVEVNHAETATEGKFVVTHGNSGKFGQEFSSTYADVLINSMSYDDIVANVKYNSSKVCYNHAISTLEVFFENCAQLGLGVYLRTYNATIVGLARKFMPDNKIVIAGGASVRTTYNFKGMLTSYIGTGDSSTICTLEYLRNHVAANGGAPYHLVMLASHIEYMIAQGTLENIVGTLRNEGIYIGGCYASSVVLEQLTAVGGIGHAAQAYQCNSFNDANFGVWSPLDSDLSQWTIAEGITGTSDGKLVNNTNAELVVRTPSTGELPLAKGQVQARIKGNVTFTFGGHRGSTNPSAYSGYDEEKPINLNAAGIYKNMQLTITIGANSSVEFLNYQVTRC